MTSESVMGADPMVGVIMPVFNRASVVAEAVESALAQTHPFIQVHAVDDGSTDGSGEVLDEIAASDDRVVVNHQANAGPAAARNRAIAGCDTEWITFLDSDDLLVPHAIERQFAWLADNPGHDAVMGRCQSIIQPGVDASLAIRAKLAADETTPLFHSVLIRKVAIDDAGGYDESMRHAEDTDLHWRLVEAGVTIGAHEDVLLHRRVFGDNLTFDNPDWTKSLLDMAQRTLDRKRRPDDGT